MGQEKQINLGGKWSNTLSSDERAKLNLKGLVGALQLWSQMGGAADPTARCSEGQSEQGSVRGPARPGPAKRGSAKPSLARRSRAPPAGSWRARAHERGEGREEEGGGRRGRERGREDNRGEERGAGAGKHSHG